MAAFAAEVPPPQGEKVVLSETRWELLYTRTASIQGGLTEGPAAAPDGSIYFSDIPFGKEGGLIVRFDPKTKQTSLFTDDSGKSNGLVFDKQGRLLACEGANFRRTLYQQLERKHQTKDRARGQVPGQAL